MSMETVLLHKGVVGEVGSDVSLPSDTSILGDK
jgi:hypothetical protein